MTGSPVPDRFPPAAGTTRSRLVPRFPLPTGTGNRSARIQDRFPTHLFPPEREPLEGNQSTPTRHISACLADLLATLRPEAR